MTENERDERRRRYFEDHKDMGRHRAAFFLYERLAIDFATSAMKVLTYLNGGGLIAIQRS
jgi:hypothetical protein